MAQENTRTHENIQEGTDQRTETPPLYRVFLLNDDYTTMEFVVHVLESVFHKSSAEATRIMLHVHKKGIGLCGVFTKDIAETKMGIVHLLAEKNGFPLKCTMDRQ